MNPLTQNYLHYLEAESIYIIREAYSQIKNLGILFSGGKYSIVLTHLCMRAFHPHPMPIPLLHIDTGHNFEETLQFRDEFVKKHNLKLIVESVEESIRLGEAKEETGIGSSRNAIQSITLLKAIEKHRFGGLFGGGRRDEEKSRSKERIFSHRNEFGQWNPKSQRPELWHLYNGKLHPGENMRIFPLSNWTEYDIWNAIRSENYAMPSLYFAHSRKMFSRGGSLYAFAPFIQLRPEEEVFEKKIRFRTIGDITCTCAIESSADDFDSILYENNQLKTSERGLRADDKRSDAALEERKRQGYF